MEKTNFITDLLNSNLGPMAILTAIDADGWGGLRYKK